MDSRAQEEQHRAFALAVSRPSTPALLRAPPRNSGPGLRRQRKKAPPTRTSLRIAARGWPKGGAEEKARQVLMKKLGVPEDEGLSPDDCFLHYFSLFRGPLNDDAVKAMTALCSLEDASATPV